MFSTLYTSSYGKEQIVNENFALQEAFNRGVIDRTLSNPPANPNSNGFYIPAAVATGAWSGKENQLLWWSSIGEYWRAIAPSNGMKINSQADNNFFRYSAATDSWNLLGTGSTNQVFAPIANETELENIDGAIAGDFVKVLDADGNGNQAWYLYDGIEWQKLVTAIEGVTFSQH